jgi:hypothetical protein
MVDHKLSTYILFFIGVVIIIGVGASAIDGYGSRNVVAKFIDGELLGNSSIIDDGVNVTFTTPVYASSLVLDTLNVNNGITANNLSTFDDIIINGDIININGANLTGNIIPGVTNTFTLGNRTMLWKNVSTNDLYVANRLGVGNPTPSALLTVTSTSSNIVGRFEQDLIGGNATLRLRSTTTSGNNMHGDIVVVPTSTSADVGYIGLRVPYNAATPPFVVDTNGRVGIGTTTPGYKLEVNGSGRFLGALSTSSGYNVDSGNDINVANGRYIQEGSVNVFDMDYGGTNTYTKVLRGFLINNSLPSIKIG